MPAPLATFTDQSLAIQVANSVRLMQQERNRRRADMGLDPLPIIPGTISYVTSGTSGHGVMSSSWVIDGPEIWNFKVNLLTGGNVLVAAFHPTDYYSRQLNKYPIKNKYATGDGYYNLFNDDLNTTKDQISTDRDNANAGHALIPLYTLDDLVPYTGQRLMARQLSDTWGYLGNEETKQVSQALRTTDEATAAVISSQTVTDPLGTQLLHNLLGSAVASDIGSGKATTSTPAVSYLDNTPIKTILSDTGVDLSSGLSLSEAQQVVIRADQLATQTAKAGYDDPAITAQNKLNAEAEDLYYWQANYPTVIIRPDDNPQLDSRFLYEDWPSWAGEPPLVNIQILPRQKEAPTMGFLGGHSWVGTIAGLIPVVGQVAAVAISIEAGNERDNYLKDFMGAAIVTDPFKPQLFPKPFYVLLPLDLAQMAVHQPWYVVSFIKRFHEDLRSAQLGLAQHLLSQGSVSQSVNQTGLPQNLMPGSNQAIYDPGAYVDNEVTSQLLSNQSRGGSMGAGITPSSQLAGGTAEPVDSNNRDLSTAGSVSPATIGIIASILLAVLNSK